MIPPLEPTIAEAPNNKLAGMVRIMPANKLALTYTKHRIDKNLTIDGTVIVETVINIKTVLN